MQHQRGTWSPFTDSVDAIEERSFPSCVLERYRILR
ncbi:MAG: hypothetical protein KatS3mg038_0635 [Candidatus Kapaibacterium sp.]|nr:MAG: hypothetical protein KatS3mg038_0635 [Candidatus Kapabacteria bacterium]GIV56957.1 MAG: hypothetical protein KatS3mg040_1725 [Candidatus Kapabacteria bacterium]